MITYSVACICFLILSAGLQAQSSAFADKNDPPAHACPKGSGPDALRMMAETCAKDLGGDSNCRAHVKDGAEDYVIVRDCSPNKPQAYLMIPVKPVSGIEDSQIFSTMLVNLWDAAWRWAQKYPGAPSGRTALAVNSNKGRSQNQLHIHISCIRRDISDALAQAPVPLYPAKPVILSLGLEQNRYQVVKVADLMDDHSPFKVVQSLPGMAYAMKDQSIAVVEAKDSTGFYVLDTTAGGTNRGHAEELLDQECR